jgi:predicted DCC family thiol-disulfide oxidoreductase YuxK
MTDILPHRLVLFDGVCNLCNSSVTFIISHDPEAHFTFASLQSDEGQRILRLFGLPTADFDSFVYIREGRVYQRSAGALYVLRDLGGASKLMYAFIIVPRPVRDMVYDLIARYRYRIFGRRDSCMVPTPELRNRFLS